MKHPLTFCLFQCHSMVMIYGQSMINIIKEDGAVDRICSEIALCSANDALIKIAKKRIGQEVINFLLFRKQKE